MKRSRKIVLICHCIINGNAKVESLSSYSGMIDGLVDIFKDRGWGIIQLPCPEMIMYGIRRWGHVKEQFDTLFFRKQCQEMLRPIIQQVKSYIDAGYEIVGVIGIDGSPSCGVHYTCSGDCCGEISNFDSVDVLKQLSQKVEGSGVFIEELKKGLEDVCIQLSFTAINEENVDGSLKQLILS